MYCLVYTRSSLGVAALIFYTIVWLPLVQLKRSLLGLVVQPRVLDGLHELRPPAARFGDLRPRLGSSHGNAGREEGGESELCSICLAEMEEEEAVSELPGCGHVFHWCCIERWLERCQFTCPLCRSLLFDRCKSLQHMS